MFDAHVHIIDPRFPLIANEGFVPAPFTIADYTARMGSELSGSPYGGVVGGTVVSGSFQGTDQTYLTAALAELGPSWVGVTQLPLNATDDDILALDAAGVRGMRFNLRRAAIDIVAMTQHAIRAYDLVGWHVEMYVDGSTIASLEPVVAKLPLLCVDHLGMSEEGLPTVLRMVERGLRVKASGFGRLENLDIADALTRVHAVNPGALIFGADLPAARAARAFRRQDIDLIADVVGDDLPRVLADNALDFYRRIP
ncbi:MAG: amidohydrolase family protein [Mycobacteriaceae bacterium]|nr:amidohydrolase family protein [Mycobacteriaceae bacterium]